MYYNPATSSFFNAIADILLSTGEVSRNDDVNSETLDRALRAYIYNVIEDYEYHYKRDPNEY